MISFFTQNIVYNLPERQRFRRWIHRILLSNNRRVYALNYIFCSDAFMQEMNRDYLGHDFCTDVLSFDHSDLYANGKISGDIYISIDTVVWNAQVYASSFEEELLRVMAHGLLHLLGFDDFDDEVSKVMRQQEDCAIALFNVV